MVRYKNPRNKGLKGFPKAHIKNPSCGDDITMEALVEDGVIKEIRHQGSGCSICCSSASVLSETLKGYEVIAMDILHKPFDPNTMNAVMVEEVEGMEPNMVVDVLQKGYTYKGKVIRYAMVKVSK